MNLSVAVAGAVPAILAMAYFDRLDRKRPEPPATLRLVAFVGALSVIPCVGVELGLQKLSPAWLAEGYAGALFKGFVVAALVEELAKALCLRFVVWRRPEFDERLDGIVYATRAALGFALLENVGYLFGTKTLLAFAATYAVRAVLTVPMHALSAAVMGYYAARRRFDGEGPGFLGGYALAVLIHGTFDSALFATMYASAEKSQLAVLLLLPVPVLVTVGSLLVVRRLARRALAGDDAERGELELAPSMRPAT